MEDEEEEVPEGREKVQMLMEMRLSIKSCFVQCSYEGCDKYYKNTPGARCKHRQRWHKENQRQYWCTQPECDKV